MPCEQGGYPPAFGTFHAGFAGKSKKEEIPTMKKFLSLALALVMTMSLVTVSAGAKDFTDDSKITYQEAVDVMSAVGVIDGYTDGSFQPTTNLTRGAAAKIICNLILGPTTASALGADTAPYKDVPTSNVFAGYIAYCQKEGIISGYADGTFKPAAPLTGYAFMKMLLGALGYDSSKEGYTGPNWSINVAKQAIAIGLDDGNDKFVGQNSVNREEAMLYAFNAMQATMVEYGNDTTITVGDVVVSQSGKASEMVNNASNETIKNDDKMQFAEKYFSDLKLSANGADAFNRPANVWKVKAEEVGTYAKVADATYTESVKISDIYKDLGLGKTIVKADVSVYEDGASSTAVAISKSDDTKLGGNGVLTQVYYNTDKETVTITMVNTYVGTVNRTVAASGNQNRHLEITTEAERPTGASGTEKFDTLEEFEDDAYVLYTFSIPEDAVQSVKTAEAIQGTLTKVVNGKSLDIDSSTYKLSNKYVAESLDVDSSYAVYLDEYGYAIYVEEQEFVSGDYALFVEAQDKSNFSSNRALLVFTDGTYKVVDTAKNYANGTSKIEKNSIVTYKVDDNKEYTLKAVATTKKVENSQTFSMTNGTSKITLKDSDVVYSNSNTVFVVETGDDEYETYVGTNNAPGIKASTGSNEQVTAYYYCKTGSIVTVMFIVPGSALTVENSSNNVLFIAGKSASQKITTKNSEYYEYNAVINGETTTVKIDSGISGASNLGNGLYKSYSTDSHGVITKLNKYTTSSTNDKYAVNDAKGTAKVSGEYTVTLGGASYTVDSKANLFYVDEDGKITSTGISGIAKDTNDLAYFIVDNGQITNLFIQEVDDKDTGREEIDAGDYAITISRQAVTEILVASGAKKTEAALLSAVMKQIEAEAGSTISSYYRNDNGDGYVFEIGKTKYTWADSVTATDAVTVSVKGVGEKLYAATAKISDLGAGEYALVSNTESGNGYKEKTTTLVDGGIYDIGYYKVTMASDKSDANSEGVNYTVTDAGKESYLKKGQTVTLTVTLSGTSTGSAEVSFTVTNGTMENTSDLKPASGEAAGVAAKVEDGNALKFTPAGSGSPTAVYSVVVTVSGNGNVTFA